MVDKIRGLAEEAGREIMKFYKSGDWSVTAKVDQSPVTQADLAANAILVEGIRKFSDVPVVSEESDPQGVVRGKKFWLIDPLDGTRDFVSRLDTFVVCVALIEDSRPVSGVIHAPVTGETWWAEKGRGAFNSRGSQLFIKNERVDLIAAGSRSLSTEKVRAALKLLNVRDVQLYGSALKFCRLAESAIDLYPRLGPTFEWDTAAGQLIVEEAGGKVLAIDSGQTLTYGKPKLENVGGFIASRGDLDLISALKSAALVR